MLVSTLLRICKHFALQEHNFASSEKKFCLSIRLPQNRNGGEHTRSRYQRAPIKNSCGMLASTRFCICTHFHRKIIKWETLVWCANTLTRVSPIVAGGGFRMRSTGGGVREAGVSPPSLRICTWNWKKLRPVRLANLSTGKSE